MRADECGELPPVNRAFMVPEGRGRERGRYQVGFTIFQLQTRVSAYLLMAWGGCDEDLLFYTWEFNFF